MKRLSSILFPLSICVLFSTCKETEKAKCLAFPQSGLEYFDTKHAGATVTYFSLNHSDSVTFDCSVIEASDCYTLPWSIDEAPTLRGDCGPQAKQILSRPLDSIIFITTGFARPNEVANSFWTDITTNAFLGLKPVISWQPNKGTLIPDNYEWSKDYVNQILIHEWTSADGTRYENVYHLVPDDETALYLAPGYGIVQIEAAGKTYCLKP